MISDERLLSLCRALSSAVAGGLPLGEAFAGLARSSAHGRALSGAAEFTAAGKPLHQALAEQGIFPPVFIALVRAGEESGKVDEFLDRFADCLEVRVEFRRRLSRALVYPAFAVLLALALLFFFSYKAVPMLLEPLVSAGLPAPKGLWMRDAAGWLAARWQLAGLGALAAVVLLRWLWLCRAGRTMRALAGHWLPGVRYAAEEGRLYHLCSTMGLLLQAGLQAGAMMDILAQFFDDDPVTRRRLARGAKDLSRGRGFCESIAPVLPPEDVRSVRVAEKSGKLDETLLRLGKSHRDLNEHRMKVLGTLFKIGTTVALAPMCFALILSLLWPLLSTLSGLKAVLLGGSGADEPEVRIGYEKKLSADEARWARFNEAHAKDIAGFMRSRGTGGKDGASWNSRPKLGAPRQMGSMRFKPIQPTAIQATDVSGSRK